MLEFINEFDRCAFSKELEQVMCQKKIVKWFYMKQKELIKSAVTRKKRTKMLEAFLKSVFSEVSLFKSEEENLWLHTQCDMQTHFVDTQDITFFVSNLKKKKENITLNNFQI